MKKTFIALLGAIMLIATGCTSGQQFYGAATGASLGGLFGSAIGGITGGHRGHNVGTIVGMAVGGMVGAAATAPKTDDGNYRSSDYNYDYNYNRNRDNDYNSGNYNRFADIEVSNVRFIDTDRNNCLDADEHAKITFEIRNIGSEYGYDIAPVITVTGTKQIYLSPTAIISELAPGGGVRYSAEVVATRKLRSGVADFSIGFSDGNQLVTFRSFQLRTRGR